MLEGFQQALGAYPLLALLGVGLVLAGVLGGRSVAGGGKLRAFRAGIRGVAVSLGVGAIVLSIAFGGSGEPGAPSALAPAPAIEEPGPEPEPEPRGEPARVALEKLEALPYMRAGVAQSSAAAVPAPSLQPTAGLFDYHGYIDSSSYVPPDAGEERVVAPEANPLGDHGYMDRLPYEPPPPDLLEANERARDRDDFNPH